MGRRLKRVGLALLLLIGIALGVGYFQIRELERHVLLSGPEWDKKIGRFLEDQNRVSQIPWFRGGFARVPVPPEIVKASQSVPESLVTRLRERRLAGSTPAKTEGPGGMGWMSKLSGFDFWPSEAPSPAWLLWAMSRWSSGQDGDQKKAFVEARELARLAGTSQRWADAMDMMLVLHGERDEYDKAVIRGKVFPGFVPFDKETLEQASRVIEVTGDFFDFRWPPPALAAIFGDPSHRIGLCAGIEHGLDLQLRLRPFLETHYPDRFRILDQVLTQTEGSCRLSAQRKAWADRTTVPKETFRSERSLVRVGGKAPPPVPVEQYEKWKDYAKIPLVNWYYGLKLAQIGSPDPELARQY